MHGGIIMEGKVSEIIDQYTIAINIGKDKGVSNGMKFHVLEPNITIKDPQTGETLGEFDYIKATVEIITVYERFSIARSCETITTLVLPFPSITSEKRKKLLADSYRANMKIGIGDIVRLIKSNMITYVKCSNCGKEFKSPIQVKNLAETIIQGNKGVCPHCNQEILIENKNMFNKN